MQMPGRHTEDESYRYAYNGMEQDNEVSGNGNSYTTEFRQYDPRLGRWKSLDPIMAYFPHMSPYAAFDNNPIYYTDPFGLSATNEGAGDNGPNEGGQAGDKGSRIPDYLKNLNIVVPAAIEETSAKNLYIVIQKRYDSEGTGTLQVYNKIHKETYQNNSYLVVFGTNLVEAEKEAVQHFGSKRPENTVIQTHGLTPEAYNPNTREVEMTGEYYISGSVPLDQFDLRAYNNGNLDGEKKAELDALARIINWTEDDCALQACGLGSQKTFVDRLDLFYEERVTSGANFFINIDATQAEYINGRVVTSRQVMTRNRFTYGWIMFSSDGGKVKLTDDPQNTGNLILDDNSADGMQIEKRNQNE